MLMLFPLMTLMADAAQVIEIRLRMMALGQSTSDEMFLMVTEKIDAIEQAKKIIIRGGDPSLVIENYQKIVAANVARLSERRSD
jgi:hypothetical protein